MITWLMNTLVLKEQTRENTLQLPERAMLEWLLYWNFTVSKRFTDGKGDKNFPGKEMIHCLRVEEAQMALQFFVHALCFGGTINNQIVRSMRIPLRSIFCFPLQGSLLDISTYIFCCHLKTTLSRFIPASVAKVLELSETPHYSVLCYPIS